MAVLGAGNGSGDIRFDGAIDRRSADGSATPAAAETPPAPARPADRAETSPEAAPSQAAAQTQPVVLATTATHQLLVKVIEEEEPFQLRPRRRPVELAIRSRLLSLDPPRKYSRVVERSSELV